MEFTAAAIKLRTPLTVKFGRGTRAVTATRPAVNRDGSLAGAWDTTGRFWKVERIVKVG